MRIISRPAAATAVAGVLLTAMAAPAAAEAPAAGGFVPAGARVAAATAADLTTTVEQGVTRSGARRMHTDATWFPAERRLVATTRTWNAVKLTGFTGGVVIVFEDAQGRVIGATDMRTFGVDGMWIGRYDRTDVWEETIDAPWLDRAVSIRAVHSHAGRVRLKEIVDYAVATLQPVIDLINDLESSRPES
jgi:hypothetical protein